MATVANLEMQCVCGSDKNYSDCCAPYINLIGIKAIEKDSILVSWLDKYSNPIMQTFRRKTLQILFRISVYAEFAYSKIGYLGCGFYHDESDYLDQAIISTKRNIIHSFLGATSCLSQGLFLQCGALIRCCIEDSFVILDLLSNEDQLRLFLRGKYLTGNVLSRIRQSIPRYFLKWYGHFSANYAHFGPFHCAPYIPKKCYPDNYILGSGLENLLLGIYLFHVTMERAHISQIKSPIFWLASESKTWYFNEENYIAEFVNAIQKDTFKYFPPDEKKENFIYGPNSYKAK